MRMHIVALGSELRRQINELCQKLDEVDRGIEHVKSAHTGLAAQITELKVCIQKAAIAATRCQTIPKEQAVLTSLDYGCRPTRSDAIHKAHESTFEWIYADSSGSTAKDHRFLEWSKKGDGLFWIRGKPGAGKSTLMKFISDQPRTKNALEVLSSPDNVVIGSHYFWSAGSALQKSYKGLLQSILFELFSQHPELIAPICQEESWWTRFVKSKDLPIVPKWSEASLAACLDRLATSASLPVAVRFCLFIDGLDEYAGRINGEAKDFTDMCQTLSKLTASRRIKICVSSRPENVFREHFGGDQSRVLDVHELTAGDIERYARDNLEDLGWERLARGRREGIPICPMDYFVRQIQSRSQGVFLWVFLVVRVLRNGLTNGDTLQELEQRLNSCPSDLEPFLRRILETIDPCYHQKIAAFLRLTQLTLGNTSFVLYVAHEDEYDRVRPLLYDPTQRNAIVTRGIEGLDEQTLIGHHRGLTGD